MRTVRVFLITLLLAGSANAVVITCVNEGDGVVRIDYSATDETVLPIAFALDVSVDGGAIIEQVYDYKVGDSNSASPGYGIFPHSIQLDFNNGSVIDWGTPVAGGLGTSTVTLQMASRYNGSENAPRKTGTLCRIRVNTGGADDVNVAVTPNIAGGGVVLENATAAKLNGSGVISGIQVVKCTVTAGSKPSSDSITISGLLDAGTDDFTTGGSIVVTVDSADLFNPCTQTFPIDVTTYKNGKYKCTVSQAPLKTSFAYDTRTRKFSFSAKNISLKGLSSPLSIEVNIGSNTVKGSVDETIVNGSKKPVPIKLMMGVKNILRIDKITVKRSTKSNGDQLMVRGGFAVLNTGMNMADESLIVTLGSQEFTIPANSFEDGTAKFNCSKVVITEGGVASASFEFDKGAYTLTIKNTKITVGTGNADLRLSFADFNEVKQISIP